VIAAPAQASPDKSRTAIWTPSFAAVCVAIFLAYAHNGLLTPTIPLYLHGLGASEGLIGLALAAFSITAVCVRPFIGYWTDAWSAIGMAGLGLMILGTTSLIFMLPLIAVIAGANALRGVGWAGTNTGTNTLVAHIAPPARRGEASGYYSMFQSGAAAMLPLGALWLVGAFSSGYVLVFAAAAAFGLAGAAVTRLIAHWPDQALPQASPVPGGLRLATLIDRQVIPVTLIQIVLSMGQSAASSFIPLFAQRLGLDLKDVGWYFVAGGVVSVIGRGPLGRLSDRFGRGPSIAAGFLAIAVAFLLLSTASSLPALIAAGVVYSFGFAGAYAAVLALAFDRANPARRGTAMATFSLGTQLGLGLGATIWGGLIELLGYSSMYLVAMGSAVLGMTGTLLMTRLRHAKPSITHD